MISIDAQKRIKYLMNERKWTNYRLAIESGLSHSTVANMLNRNNAPTLATLEAVCAAFEITMSQFFHDENNPSGLTDEQEALFSKWSTLTIEQRQILLDLIDTM